MGFDEAPTWSSSPLVIKPLEEDSWNGQACSSLTGRASGLLIEPLKTGDVLLEYETQLESHWAGHNGRSIRVVIQLYPAGTNSAKTGRPGILHDRDLSR